MTNSASSDSTVARRRWLTLAAAGCGLVVLAMLLSALAILDKTHFGWMVGRAFLGFTIGSCMLGALLMLIGALKLPERWTWRGIVLLVWALIALTSPGFGWVFLLPWGVLVLMLPVVIPVFVSLFRQGALAHSTTGSTH